MKNILVPTDFSDCAGNALDFALYVAKKNKAKIHLLHIFNSPINWIALPKEREADYPEIKKKIGTVRGKLSQLKKEIETLGIKAEKSLVFQEADGKDFQNTDFHHYDTIIMGSHGASGSKELLLGSNAQYVLENANIPVMIIKEKVNTPINRILFVSDFRESFVKSFPPIVDFANKMEAYIHLVYVNVNPLFDKQDEIKSGMERLSRYYPRPFPYSKAIVDHDNKETAIVKYAQENYCDMIAILSTQKRSGLLGMFKPSLSRRIMNHADIPVFITKG